MFVTSIEMNIHRDALCFMITGISPLLYSAIGSWWLGAGGSWGLAVDDDWRHFMFGISLLRGVAGLRFAAVGSGWRLAVGGSWGLVVVGPWPLVVSRD